MLGICRLKRTGGKEERDGGESRDACPARSPFRHRFARLPERGSHLILASTGDGKLKKDAQNLIRRAKRTRLRIGTRSSAMGLWDADS